MKFLGTKSYVSEVTAFEPNRFIELTTLEGAVLPKLTQTFQAEGERTIYTRRVRFETRGLFKVMEPLIERMPSPERVMGSAPQAGCPGGRGGAPGMSPRLSRGGDRQAQQAVAYAVYGLDALADVTSRRNLPEADEHIQALEEASTSHGMRAMGHGRTTRDPAATPRE